MPQARLCQPILEAVPEIKDNQLMITHLEGSINIIGLRFRYSKSDPWLFDGFDLHIEPGEFIGITGPSSCGKSTLLRLLLGFEDPTEGYIYYDRFNLRDVNKPSLRRNCVSVGNYNVRVLLSLSDQIPYATATASSPYKLSPNGIPPFRHHSSVFLRLYQPSSRSTITFNLI